MIKCNTLGCNDPVDILYDQSHCPACVLVTEIRLTDSQIPSGDACEQLPVVCKHNHYFKDVRHLDVIDPYRLLLLYQVTDPALQHISKKALCAGLRGHKDFRRDLQDIIDTAQRRLAMLKEDEKATR